MIKFVSRYFRKKKIPIFWGENPLTNVFPNARNFKNKKEYFSNLYQFINLNFERVEN